MFFISAVYTKNLLRQLAYNSINDRPQSVHPIKYTGRMPVLLSAEADLSSWEKSLEWRRPHLNSIN